MNISVYYGRAGSGKTRAVYERIRQVMTDCPGEPIILLVPEPATYRVERELAEFMPEKGKNIRNCRRIRMRKIHFGPYVAPACGTDRGEGFVLWYRHYPSESEGNGKDAKTDANRFPGPLLFAGSQKNSLPDHQ